jgi:hypothetical protein
MLKGTVIFRTRIKSNGLRFPLVEFNPNVPGVDKVEIEAPNGYEIHAAVYLSSVASPNEGRELAAKVHMAALDRIAFTHDVGIENPQRISEQYSPPVVVDATVSVGSRFVLVPGIDPTQLKDELERPSPPGENNYGLFRSARQSVSPVEEFMHLYHILLMLCNDDQAAVDSFIKSQDPSVRETPQPPIKRPRKARPHVVMETVYTKLRNQLAHKRPGVNLDTTKSEMGTHLGGLIALTKRAIALHP